jgi:diguanylate cyclase (GGDEF)-like protein/PAS domain S-box-containing protein
MSCNWERLKQFAKQATEFIANYKRTKQLLIEHEAYQRAIFDATPDAMLISNEQGVITMLNRQAETLLGYFSDELLGQSIEMLVPNRYRAEHPNLRKKFADLGVTRLMGVGKEVKALRKDGSELEVEISLSTIKTAQGLFFASALRDVTARKKIESVLCASEERFRKMADNSPIIIWVTDTKGMTTFVNQSWRDLTGLDSQSSSLTNNEWLNSIHPDDKKTLFDEYFKNDKCSKTITTEYRLRNANGGWSWILDKGTPLFDIDGEFMGYIGSAIDITERYNAQKLLHDKERMLSESQRIAHIGSWSLELTTDWIEWSDEMYRIFGVARESFDHSTKEFIALIHPDDRAAMVTWISESLAGKPQDELDFRIMQKNGDIRFIRGNGGLQYNDMNPPLHMVGNAQDITERKEAEKVLHQIKAMIDISLDGFWIVDMTGKILQTNEAYAKMSGYSIDELVNMKIAKLEASQDAAQIQANIAKIIAEGQSVFETRHRHKDGHEIDIEVSVAFLPEFQQFCAFLRDISERKRIELDLKIAATTFQSQDAMVITDTDSVILRINKAFTLSTGYTEADAIGQKISILKSGRHDTAFYKQMWDSLQTIGGWQGEIWDRRKNGEIYPKWLSITAVKGQNGITTHYIGTHIDITEHKAAEEQIKQLAFYDPLTQLPNRRLLEERLKHGINVERRDGKQLALLILDLDKFKAVNDTLGHLAGDELLQQVAARITGRLREIDMVARLGGDEFVVLLESITHTDDVTRIAEEIIIELTKPFCLTQSDNVQIGASIGISLYPQHGDTPELLMVHADAALYQAKNAGRGCFAYFSEA